MRPMRGTRTYTKGAKRKPPAQHAHTTEHVSRQRPVAVVPDKVLEQVVDAACVPEGLRAGAMRRVGGVVFYLKEQVLEPLADAAVPAKIYSLGAIKAEVRRFTRDVEEFADAIRLLEGPAHFIVKSAADSPHERTCEEEEVDPPRLEQFETFLRQWAQALRAHFLSPAPKAPNRPPGSVKNPKLHLLVRLLYEVLKKEGHGRLTLSMVDGQITGTLPAVLKLLRPYLPHIISAALPYETLRDIRKTAQSERRDRTRV
jgi:hypothetical protein